VEAYGAAGPALAVTFEIATDAAGPALVQAAVPALPGGKERTIFSGELPVAQLPPGKYLLRAVVSSSDRPLKTMTRPFEIGAPAVLMTSADRTSAPPSSELYLPVGDELAARTFRRDSAARAETLRAFREHVAPASRSAFDKGAASLATGDYAGAEQAFKAAITVDGDSSAAIAYLGATYAASGRDAEAAGAWQTSLVDGSGVPDTYEWLGDALIRSHELAEARATLEEAQSKWPADVRFAKPLALVYATFGLGREAVRTLEPYLIADQDDREALALGVEWIYQLHFAGAAAHTPADDLKLAKQWAGAYEKAKGARASLVRQWMLALETAPPQ
jgi:tetratricopeptide (TPR) repeat protein